MELYQQQLNIVWKSVFKDEIEVSIHNCVTQAIWEFALIHSLANSCEISLSALCGTQLGTDS